MKTRLSAKVAAWSAIALLSLATVAEARVGGGRSGGFRGSRSFGRSAPYSAPARPANPSTNNYANPAQPQQPFAMNRSGTGGAFTRGLVGGLAGGFIGSMLFRNSGLAGTGAPGTGGAGGIGLLEILLFGGLAYMVFRYVQARRQMGTSAFRSGGEPSHYEKLRSVEPGPFVSGNQAEGELKRIDPGFESEAFKDERMDDFLKIQAAWGEQDLSRVSVMIGPELKRQLDSDLAELKGRGHVNRVENIAVRGTDLVEAWEEAGQVFATVRFRANVTDYTVDSKSGDLVTGSKTEPVRFEEEWTFVRRSPSFGLGGSWVLSAIDV